MAPYISRYRRILVIAFHWFGMVVRRRKGQEIHCLLFLWERLREPLPGYSGAVLFYALGTELARFSLRSIADRR